MKHIKFFTLATAAIISLPVSAAFAADNNANYPPHYSIPEKPYAEYAEQLPPEEKIELVEYVEYEQREPCQFYQPIPEGFVQDGCNIVREEPKQIVAAAPQKTMVQTEKRKVLSDYDIHFAFDSANIEPAAGNTIDQIANEINTYKPGEVTVAGFADKAGPNDYNMTLSQERAMAVSQALTQNGVPNHVIDKEAYGETHPAVDTPDGVPNAENRRVVVEFLK